MKVIFNNISITKIITALPDNIKNIDDDLETLYNNDKKALNRIKKVIGLQNRAIAKENQSALDLAYHAGLKILENCEKDSIKALIFVTQTPNYFVPNNASVLQGRLDLSGECACFDINQACSGFVYGLFNAFSIVDKLNKNDRVLLICGDTISKLIKPDDTSLASMMGDGVSACLVEKVEVGESFFMLKTQGKDFYKLVSPGRAFKKDYGDFPKDLDLSPIKNNHGFLFMDGAGIFNFAITHEPKAILETLDFSKINISNIDYFLFHQANKYTIDNIVKRLELDSNICPNTTTAKFGNLSAASIPTTICDVFESNINKDLTLFLGAFGAGLSMANAILKLNKDHFINQKIIFV